MNCSSTHPQAKNAFFTGYCEHHRETMVCVARTLLGSRDEAEDAVQIVLLRIWADQRRLDRLRQIDNPRSYLLRAAQRQALNMARDRQRRRLKEQRENVPGHEEKASPSYRLEVGELQRCLAQAPERLTVAQRRVYYQIEAAPEKSSRQLGAILGYSHRNVLNHRKRICKALYPLLKIFLPGH